MYDMEDYEETWVLSHLMIYVQILIFPVYFLILGAVLTENIELPLINDENLSIMLTSWLGPILFAIPFMIWTILKRYQLAGTYELMGGKVISLPVAVRAFYGFNFVVALIFLLPFVAPIVGILGGYWFALIIVNRNREESKGFRNSRTIKTISLIYGLLAALLALAFYFQILPFFDFIYGVWDTRIEDIYGISIALADAVTFGGLLYFFFERTMDENEIPEWRVFSLDFVLFIILAGMFLMTGGSSSNNSMLSFIHVVAVIISGSLIALRILFGMTTSSSSSIKAWLTVLIFQAINFASGEAAFMTKTTAVFIAFILFAAFFYSAYREASSRY